MTIQQVSEKHLESVLYFREYLLQNLKKICLQLQKLSHTFHKFFFYTPESYKTMNFEYRKKMLDDS